MTDPDDRTIDAGPDALARLREIAREAERSNGAPAEHDPAAPDDRTVEAGTEALDALRRAALAAPAPASVAPRRPRDLATLPDIGEIPEIDRPGARRVATPPEAGPWQPPPRSMRPASVPETVPGIRGAHPLWKWVALVLAAIVVVLVAWLALGRGGGPDDDVPSGPTVTGPSGTVLTTGVAGEGGSGG